MTTRPDSIVHVIGAGRGGTSLLAALIDAHPDCEVVFERYSLGLLMRDEDPSTRAALDPAELARRRVQEFLAACAREASLHPGRVWGHKSTTEQIGALEELSTSRFDALAHFADEISPSRVLFILRDGRSCVASKVRRTGQSPETAVARWRFAVRLLELLRTRCPRLLVVRFEELVLDPKSALRQVCAFLEVAFDPAMLRGTNSPKMLEEYRRQGLDATTTQVDNCPGELVEAMRLELEALGYLPSDPGTPAAGSAVVQRPDRPPNVTRP